MVKRRIEEENTLMRVFFVGNCPSGARAILPCASPVFQRKILELPYGFTSLPSIPLELDGRLRASFAPAVAAGP